MSDGGKPLRIGLSVRTFNPQSGGLQAHAHRLADQLRGRGHQVTIVTRTVTQWQNYQDYFRFTEPASVRESAGIPIHVISRTRACNPLLWFVSKCVVRPPLHGAGISLYQHLVSPQIRAAFRNVDLIQHIGQGSEMIGFAALAAARSLGVPFLVQTAVHPGQWGDWELDFRLYRQADRLLAFTEYEARYFASQSVQVPVDVTGIGIDHETPGCSDRFRRQHALAGPLILFLGRKSADKGYPLLLTAFAQLRQKLPTAVLVAMGPSDNHSTQPTDGVLDLAYAEDPVRHDALAACDVLCVPSEGESFGLVFMEAGRYRKPLIARRLPVLEELFGRHDAALLIGRPAGQGNRVDLEPGELVTAMLQVLTDPSLACRLGDNARARSDKFTWPEIAGRYEEAYHLALGAHRISNPGCNQTLGDFHPHPLSRRVQRRHR